MRTIPLLGKNAAGRVALVDDEDYELVSQYRWYLYEGRPRGAGRRSGPYALTRIWDGRKCQRLLMHTLIMGRKGIDHRDHNGLNNQRYNLRPATPGQNARNSRTRVTPKSSRYKGVCLLESGLWRAYIHADHKRRNLGDFVSEEEAAYAYDAAARELHGEFACPNFSEGPTQAMLDRWQADCEQRSAAVMVVKLRKLSDARVRWWSQREPEARICLHCGTEYRSKSTCSSYCSDSCKQKAARRRHAQRQQEGLLF